MPNNRSEMPSFACMVAGDTYNTTVRPRPGLFIQRITAATTLPSAFLELKRACSAAKPLKALFLVCHAMYGPVQLRGTPATFSLRGYEPTEPVMLTRPFGLGLGFEGVFAHNTGLWRALKGHVQSIIVYGCQAAKSDTVSVGTYADMRYIMGSLAIHSGAHVYAADEAQAADVQKDDVDFGVWEGSLFEFPPSGAPPRQVGAPPYNLSEV